tara:strand:- start:259 stop:1059 length:801 start_codon:yes stop_codon:yes gene_type:complete
MTIDKKRLINAFKRNALKGASKIGAITMYKEVYDLDDTQIEWLLAACNFKTEPKVNYEAFYNCKVIEKAKFLQNKHAQIYVIDDFLSKIDCQLIRGFIEQKAKRCTLHKEGTNDEREISNQRTSSETYLEAEDHPFFKYINDKLINLMQFNPFIAEVIHGQKYEIGEYYKLHDDFFHKGDDYEVYCEWMGQRTWTNMIYLNDVEKGGETHFPKLNLKLKPKEGQLITWNNLNKDGSSNTYTSHEALPPQSGKKYIITKWWRSWPLI